jgi:N-acetylneuraminic acid mutarotase
MQVARANLGVAVVNGNIYAIGGNTIAGEYNFEQGFSSGTTGGLVNIVEKYDPDINNWTLETPMPTERDSFAIAVYKDCIYCIGGRISIPYVKGVTDNAITDVNEVYNTTSNTWQTKTPIPTSEFPLEACSVNGIIYVIGVSGTYAYNPANDSWTAKTPAPYTSSHPFSFVSAVFHNQIYVIGFNGQNFIYDPLNNSWSILYSSQPYSDKGLMGYGLFTGVAGATTGMLASKKLYVFFGSQTYVYEPKSDSWESGAPMPNERFSYGLAVMNDTFYIIGGATFGEGFFAPYVPSNTNVQYLPIGYGTPDSTYLLEHTPPQISFRSPLNQTYYNSSIAITFNLSKNVTWIRYSLDGEQNITIIGNTTITNLPNGFHNLTIYANDTYGNVGASETVSFTVAKPEPFPTALVACASGLSVAVVGLGLLVYFKKRKR